MLALSGGMAQRLMVARAIMHRPDDRCSSTSPPPGSTRRAGIALWEILGELHGEGQTILLTTHYMEEADQLCDRLAIIDHGRLLALDTPERAEARRPAPTPSSPCPPPATSTRWPRCCAAEVPGVAAGRRASTAPSCSRCAAPRACSRRWSTAAERHGFDVTDLSVTEPTLETVFINLTGKDLRE